MAKIQLKLLKYGIKYITKYKNIKCQSPVLNCKETCYVLREFLGFRE